ncbi:hypothetical protein ACS0TY_004689 [Phlomoides rotata]
MVIWRLWKERNEELWNKTHVDAHTVVRLAKQFLEDWLSSRVALANGSSRHMCGKWHPPRGDYLKANIDATFFNTMEIGFGVIIHDSNGRHIYSRSHVMPGFYQSKKGEAIGLHEALSWI